MNNTILVYNTSISYFQINSLYKCLGLKENTFSSLKFLRAFEGTKQSEGHDQTTCLLLDVVMISEHLEIRLIKAKGELLPVNASPEFIN